MVPLSISDFPTRHNYGLAPRQHLIERVLAAWVAELGVPFATTWAARLLPPGQHDSFEKMYCRSHFAEPGDSGAQLARTAFASAVACRSIQLKVESRTFWKFGYHTKLIESCAAESASVWRWSVPVGASGGP